jgi:uncharacterized protein YggE
VRPIAPHACFAAAIAAGTLLVAPALAQTAPAAMISVTGEATVSVVPDLAQIEAGVTSEAKTAREAAAANNTAMGQVLLAVKGAGIADKDVQTAQLSLQPQSAPNRSGGSPSIAGYRVSNRVTIRLRDITILAKLIDTLVGAGANELGGINFMVSGASKLLDEAREQAIADARRKAEIYAKAAGVTLGAPLNIAEEGSPAPIQFRKMAGALAASTPVAQGEETLQVTVNVSWAIMQAAP